MGNERDLGIKENCNINRDSVCFSSEGNAGTYLPSSGLQPGSKESREYFGGWKSFRVLEMEVFELSF